MKKIKYIIAHAECMGVRSCVRSYRTAFVFFSLLYFCLFFLVYNRLHALRSWRQKKNKLIKTDDRIHIIMKFSFLLTPSIWITYEKWFCLYDACIVKIKFKNTTNSIILLSSCGTLERRQLSTVQNQFVCECMRCISFFFFFSLHFTEWKDIERWRIVAQTRMEH